MSDVLIKIDENEIDVDVDSCIHCDVCVYHAGKIKFLYKKLLENKKLKFKLTYNSSGTGDDGIVEWRAHDCGVKNEPVGSVTCRFDLTICSLSVKNDVLSDHKAFT